MSLLLALVPVSLVGAGESAQGRYTDSADALHSSIGTAVGPRQADVALRLEALLGQHSVLAADMMRGRLRGDPDFAQAANAALGKNTDALGELVAGLLGGAAARQFRSVWAAHVVTLFNYARGLADRDEAVQTDARTTLGRQETSIARWFAEASDGRLARADAEAAVRMHVHHLVRQAETFAAGNYSAAYESYRDGHTDTFRLGTTLAAALAGPGGSTSQDPEARLRSEFGRLLGEHVVLVVAAMRAGAANAADFAAAGDAVNANSKALTEAIDSLFGTETATRFHSLWNDHVTALMRYTAGVARRDSRQRAEALGRLNSFEERFATFLSAATEGRLGSSALTSAFLAHDRMLIRQVDAYAARDYQRAHDIAYATYNDTVHLADQLSAAIRATVTDRLPLGGTTAGGGGMADVVGRR